MKNKIKLSVWIIDSILLPSKVKPFDSFNGSALSTTLKTGALTAGRLRTGALTSTSSVQEMPDLIYYSGGGGRWGKRQKRK